MCVRLTSLDSMQVDAYMEVFLVRLEEKGYYCIYELYSKLLTRLQADN